MKKPIKLSYKKLPHFKPLPNDVEPFSKATVTDAGFDLYAAEEKMVPGHSTVKVKTGLAIAGMPSDIFGKIWDRSSVATDSPFSILAGVVDPDYTGELIVVVHNRKLDPWKVYKGQKIAQITFLPLPQINFTELSEQDSMPETARGDKGFGSSGE